MLGKASFTIIGWVGYVHYLPDVTKVEIGRAVPSDEKNKDGKPIMQTEWTTVTVKDHALCAWICEELDSDDLVVVEGELRDGLYLTGVNAGIPVEKSDLIVEKLDRLALGKARRRRAGGHAAQPSHGQCGRLSPVWSEPAEKTNREPS